MSELPKSWAAPRLDEIGAPPDYGFTASADATAEGPLFLRITDIQNGLVDWSGVPRCSCENVSRFALADGDIVVARTGATTGKSFQINRLPDQAVFASYLVRIRGSSELHLKWLKHYLDSPGYWEQIEENKSGSAQPGVNASKLAALVVPLAPRNEQNRIVAKLDSLRARSSRARNELDHIPKLIERYKQAILAKAFSGELTADWRGKNEAKDWQPVLIENVVDSIFDGPFGSHLKSDDYVNAGVRVIRLENIGHLAFRGDKETFISQEKYDQLRRHTLLPDDVIFSSFVDEEVRVCLFPGDLDTPAINKADCFCIRPNKKTCEPKWLAMRLASRSTYETLRDAVHGATRPRINLGTLKSLSFDLPSPQEQREMVRRIEHAFAWLDKIATEHARAEHLLPKLDQAILAKAFRGELVPQDPNDEPASVLLERIKTERGDSQTIGATSRRGRRRSLHE